MKTVLVIAYHFPPHGGAGVQRPARLVRYLPSVGYRPIVIAGPTSAPTLWTPPDPSLAEELPPDLRVVRVPGPEPAPSRGWHVRAERWLGVESPWAEWWIDGVCTATRELADEVDLIHAVMQPYETAIAMAKIAKEIRRPWIPDLGDPWALDEMTLYPTALHRKLARRKMSHVLRSATVISMSTPEAAKRVRSELPELRGHPVVAVPNGFEPLDFAGPRPSRNDGIFRIVHTGYLYTELAQRYGRSRLLRKVLGGIEVDVNVLGRSHFYLLQAVERAIEAKPELKGRLEVHLAGVMSKRDEEVAAAFPFVRMHGYLEHHDAVSLVRSADLLFLPMHDLPKGRRATIVPGKTYEYIASGTPILAAVPDGDARDYLERVGGAYISRPTDVEDLSIKIQAAFERAREGEVLVRDERAVLEFSYPRRAKRLAKLFDQAMRGRAALAREENALSYAVDLFVI